ncbi:hypothetical protein M404DRAFT_151051 [Pisolithus tinctorius Marx 270]|uniref:Uncharacterized protein n=1 Tax=Pisolithus tinctorius Marx 270 TaxID=870435 RepID=A0A0C3JUH4_PISTI|nr:hypothetical protein M404DRAFT_151051 [Pisolithus tinctorius Marx 270]
MEDPNQAVQPDFSTEEYNKACLQLVSDTTDNEQAAQILGSLWEINNNKERAQWAAHRADEARRAQEANKQAAEEQAEEQCCTHKEEEATHLEEWKKYKAKFTPICNVKAPTGPVNIPAPYASRKLLKGEYCELYFFTNAGLAEAEYFNPSIDDEALTLLKADNGQHLWVPASMTRDKSVVIKDEDLTWEQFGEAVIHMVDAMRDHDWPEESVKMHVDFWLALEGHPHQEFNKFLSKLFWTSLYLLGLFCLTGLFLARDGGKQNFKQHK